MTRPFVVVRESTAIVANLHQGFVEIDELERWNRHLAD